MGRRRRLWRACAAQLLAISNGTFDVATKLVRTIEAPVPWPIVATAEALEPAEREAFLHGLCEAVNRPDFPDRERLKAALRDIRPYVIEMEPEFVAEDRRQNLEQRAGGPTHRARPRS